MTAISFSAWDKEYCVGKIKSGVKDQTVRRPRKSPIKPFTKLQLFWKMRTKGCEKIADAVCTEYFKVYINTYGREVLVLTGVGYQMLGSSDLKNFWERDGFACAKDFWEYFGEGGDFVVIRWRLE